MRISDWSSDVCSSDLRDPVEIRPKVFLDSGHEPPGERLEVVIFYPVLGAHNDAELVAIVARLLEPVVPVHLVRVGPIELPAPALARRAVALDVAQMRSEEHTSELQSLMRISYAVFCLKKKKSINKQY